MLGVMEFFQEIIRGLREVWAGNEFWRFLGAVAILVVGEIILEILWRRANRATQAGLKKKGGPLAEINLLGFLPALRLALIAILLRGGETFFLLPEKMERILHGLYVFLLVLAAILFLFKLIRLLDKIRLVLPASFQDKIPESSMKKLKGMLRISVLVGAAAIVVHSQRTFFPEWLWKYSWWRYLSLFAILLVGYIVIRIIGRFLTSIAPTVGDLEEQSRVALILRASLWPLRLILVTIILYSGKMILKLPETAKTGDKWVDTAIGVLGTLAVILFVYRLIDVLEYELTRIAAKPDTLIDKTFAQMIRMVCKILVVIIGGIYLVRAISGKPMSTLIAGLGIGGLAVALAAQDTLKNFFGSLMLALDRPFNIGQRVKVESYDGTVEEIGWRTTRIRTLTGHLVSVPNEKMATNSIENIGRRPSIRRTANITITYDTPPDKVEKAVQIIRDILENHEGMMPDFPPRVFFNEFNDTSLNILMIYWYFPPDYWAFCDFSERVNLKMMRAFESEGIEFAFPTTTTFLAQDERRPLHITLSNDSHIPHGEGSDTAVFSSGDEKES